MYLSDNFIRKLIDISIAQTCDRVHEIISTDAYKQRLFDRITYIQDGGYLVNREKIVHYLTHGKIKKKVDCGALPITKYTKISNEELEELLNIS